MASLTQITFDGSFSMSIEDFVTAYNLYALDTSNTMLLFLAMTNGAIAYKQTGQDSGESLNAIIGCANVDNNDYKRYRNHESSTVFIDTRSPVCGDRPDPLPERQYYMFTIYIEDILSVIYRLPTNLFGSIIFDRAVAYFCERESYKIVFDNLLKIGGKVTFDYCEHQSEVCFYRIINGKVTWIEPTGSIDSEPAILEYYDVDVEKNTMSLKEKQEPLFFDIESKTLSPGGQIILFNADTRKTISPNIKENYERMLPSMFSDDLNLCEYTIESKEYSHRDYTYPVLPTFFDEDNDEKVRFWADRNLPTNELEFLVNTVMNIVERKEYINSGNLDDDMLRQLVGRARDEHKLENFEFNDYFDKVQVQLNNDHPFFEITKKSSLFAP